jgi:2-haloacid dehalogenase
MTLEADPIDVVTFDSFSTLVDVESTAVAVEGYVDDPTAFAREWHSRAAYYGIVANHVDAYHTYEQFHRLALEYLFQAAGVSATPDELDEITAVYHEMQPFADVKPAMEGLENAGYAVGIVSNGNPEMLDSLQRTLGVTDLVDAAVSADEVERYKPAIELYRHAADRFGTTTDAMCHVANGAVDVMGAKHAGMQAAWCNRTETPPEPFGPEPDATVGGLADLVERLT